MHYSDYDGYGFKRDDLQALADAMDVDLYTPIELLTEKDKTDSPIITDDAKNNSDSEALLQEIEELKRRIQELENERPILLKEYRDDDPLYLAIQIRNREWANYDPEKDLATRGNQAAIKQELKDLDISEIEATAIEKVACPIKR